MQGFNSDDDRRDFPLPSADQRPIDVLRPGSDHHAFVLAYLSKRIQASENAMEKFHPRWGYAEKRVQAYIDVGDYERLLKEVNNNRGPVSITSITIPYAYATIATIVTYLVHTFCGRKPMFGVGSYKGDMEAARIMEHALQYNADRTRLVKHLFQWFYDGELYGLGVMRTQWKREEKMRTVWRVHQPQLLGIPMGAPRRERTREMRVVFEGTDVMTIDPYMFLPDPRVPIQEVNRKGEFAAWRTFEALANLKAAEADGLIKWANDIPRGQDLKNNQSQRGRLAQGDAHAGLRENLYAPTLKDRIQVDQGTFMIVPRHLGLGESERPERWMFSIGNGGQIIQAEPFDADHDMHPVAVIEPYTMGYGFGQPGISDYLGPMQDAMSWFLNSHVHNVRSALNNMLVVDPSRIEMQDLKNPEPGKIIRMKRAAFGQDIRTMFQQLQVSDVTRSHISDMDVFRRIGDTMSSVTDNIRGNQDGGGRKTATEVRQAGESASSRLASHAKLISAQGVVDLSEQMCLNLQQYLSDEFLINVVGPQGVAKMQKISPEMLVGDFYFPINDGTLPMDRVALLDVWKEIYLGIASDPELRPQYNLGAMFEYIGELGGAQNVQRFRMDVAPEQQLMQQAQAGNQIPVDEALAGLGAGPGARLMQ